MKDNHIFPFLWMRGEEPDVLRTEMEKIYDAGIRAVCLEARPHPDYAGDRWWQDMDIIIEEAQKRDMQIWILDDAHFPTGMANNGMAKHPEKARRWLYTQFVDVTGPVPMAQVDVDLLLTKQFTWMDLGKPVSKPLYDETTLLSVTASRIWDGDTIDGEPLDLTGQVKDGYLTADIPEGTWRIHVTFSTTAIGPKPEYINYIEADSVRVLIDEVYEKHYERYKDLFGTTIAGFFSDEPGFYNTDSFGENNFIGLYMTLPWGKEMEALLRSQYGGNLYRDLPLLYSEEKSGLQRKIRAAYMDAVSTLYGKNFTAQLGDWCRAHGVQYIGHIVEDSCGHMRLGAGIGHYFRAMKGQDMAGIDNIGYQLMPGNDTANRHTGFQDLNPEFYHYELGKLGSSAAAIDPAKKGRAMCENFGAYGWRLGVRDMKWLADYLISQGINYFVPHAFSMAEYPDSDCPPHFYARGNNPQFPYFCQLMKYIDRLCRLFSDGAGVAQAAVLYEAEADWVGKAMRGSAVGKELLNHQIDFTIIPADVFADAGYYGCKEENGRLIVNGRTMDVLIVPEREYLAAPAAAFIANHPQLPVLYVNRMPAGITGTITAAENAGLSETAGYSESHACAGCSDSTECGGRAGNAFIDEESLLAAAVSGRECVPLSELAGRLTAMGIRDQLYPETSDRNLHQYHYRKNGKDYWMLMNTSLSAVTDTMIHVPEANGYGLYDAMTDVTEELITENNAFRLTLPPYGTAVIVKEPENAVRGKKKAQDVYRTIRLEDFDLTLEEIGSSEAVRMPHFRPVPISSVNRDFSGVMTYKAEFELDRVPAQAMFRARYVFECMTVFVNGRTVASVIAPPYAADISSALKEGKNEIVVSVASTALRNSNTKPGIFGKERTVLEPTGMFGDIVIELME